MIQDPSVVGTTLLDVLAQASEDADSGGGIFAFASARGIELLFDDQVIGPLARKDFQLVVGVDAITNVRALAALVGQAGRLEGLTARVLIHELGSLFHPKLCWFAKGELMTLVVGSGNLTLGGLVENLEAFTVTTFRGGKAIGAERAIERWLVRWQEQLVAPDAAEAVERAGKNRGTERPAGKRTKPEDDAEDEVPPPVGSDDVLVCEISKNTGGRRWQLNVGVEAFTGFFGGSEKDRRIVIQQVEEDGSLGLPEPPRALFPVKSQNYRFEAAAGKGVEYPKEGPPIGVFIRISHSVFRYRLLWPGKPEHAEAHALLVERGARSRRGGMLRLFTPLDAFRRVCPGSPLVIEAR